MSNALENKKRKFNSVIVGKVGRMWHKVNGKDRYLLLAENKQGKKVSISLIVERGELKLDKGEKIIIYRAPK